MDRGAWDPSPWGPKESDSTELLTLFFYFFIYGNIFIVSFSLKPVCDIIKCCHLAPCRRVAARLITGLSELGVEQVTAYRRDTSEESGLLGFSFPESFQVSPFLIWFGVRQRLRLLEFNRRRIKALCVMVIVLFLLSGSLVYTQDCFS